MEHIRFVTVITILVAMFGLLTVLSLDALDRSIYPGCKVLDQQADILIIELDAKFDEPTDTVCQAFGELVYKIAQDGYQIQVYGGHFARLGIITKEKAKRLAEGY
jgi:hypothetical protein